MTNPHPKKIGLQARKARLLAEEAENEPAYWWLSFCDTRKPAGEQFIGGSVVKARGMAHALQASWDLGCNPGGEVQGWGPIPEIPPNYPVGKLLSKPEWDRLDEEAGAQGWDFGEATDA